MRAAPTIFIVLALLSFGIGFASTSCSSNDDCTLSGTCAAPQPSPESSAPLPPDASEPSPDANEDSNRPPIPGQPLDPKTLRLTGWWRASYAGSPWAQTESAGTSATNAPWTSSSAPTVGPAQNGFAAAFFDGSSNLLAVNTPATYFTPSAWSFAMVVRATRAEPQASVIANDTGLLHDNTGVVGIAISTAAGNPSIRAYIYANGAFSILDFSSSSWMHGTYAFVQAKYDGKELKARLNSDPWKSLAVTNPAALGTAFLVGSAYSLSAPFLAGSVLEIMTADNTLSDLTFDGVRIYVNDRYKLAL